MMLAGKKVVVVGGSSGIGLATAELAKQQGADVMTIGFATGSIVYIDGGALVT